MNKTDYNTLPFSVTNNTLCISITTPGFICSLLIHPAPLNAKYKLFEGYRVEKLGDWGIYPVSGNATVWHRYLKTYFILCMVCNVAFAILICLWFCFCPYSPIRKFIISPLLSYNIMELEALKLKSISIFKSDKEQTILFFNKTLVLKKLMSWCICGLINAFPWFQPG